MGGRGRGKGRWALVVLVGCVALLVLVPTAFAANTAKIKGTVTEAGGFVPVKNIEVTVYEASGKEVPVGFASTEANGAYTVEGLPAGEYKVEFSGVFEGLNYITQYYKGASSFAGAEAVKVAEAETKENISAEMQVGGEVEGTVTDASTHKPLAKAFVVALGPGETVEGSAFTEVSGHYTIIGLRTGTYEIGFAGVGYVVQYYNGQSSFASANPVPVVQKGTASGINAALMPKIPINTVAPVASGTPAAGQTLSCTSGSWTGTPTPTFAYSWLHDGVAIPGATVSTYVVQAADQGNGLTCKVTATNKSGSVSAVSNTLIVPVPPPPPTPVLTLSSSKIVVSGGSARGPISCANATCSGTIQLTEQVVIKHRHGRKTTSTKKTLVLGKGTYSLTAGHSATIIVHLTSTGKNALAKAKHHRLSANILASVTGGTTVQKSVVLSETVPAKHRPKHK